MTISPAQRAQRRNAGKKSGQVRGGRAETGIPGSVTRPPAGSFSAASSNVEVAKRMRAFVETVGEPQSWPDVKNYVQTEAEIYKTLGVAQQFEIDAGRLLTADQVDARDESRAQAFRSGLQSVGSLLAAHVPADRLHEAQRAAREWADGVLSGVAEAIRRGGDAIK